jgi:asparagine synthase (glutamine-hydrolysing)
MSHERLAIVDPVKQPLLSEDGKLVLAANGEIYNHRELRKLKENITFKQRVIVKLSYLFTKKKGLILLMK